MLHPSYLLCRAVKSAEVEYTSYTFQEASPFHKYTHGMGGPSSFPGWSNMLMTLLSNSISCTPPFGPFVSSVPL